MFDDIDQINWDEMRSGDAPQWIKGLASDEESVRTKSFYFLLSAYIHERPRFARAVVPYILRILEQGEVNTETEVLLGFLKDMRSSANGFIRHANDTIENATRIIDDIDGSKDVFERLSDNPLTQEAALELLSAIEDASDDS